MTVEVLLPPDGEKKNIEIQVTMSVGLAQFITDVEMVSHPTFDQNNDDHNALIKEFTSLKREMRQEVEPIIIMKELVEIMDALGMPESAFDELLAVATEERET